MTASKKNTKKNTKKPVKRDDLLKEKSTPKKKSTKKKIVEKKDVLVSPSPLVSEANLSGTVTTGLGTSLQSSVGNLDPVVAVSTPPQPAFFPYMEDDQVDSRPPFQKMLDSVKGFFGSVFESLKNI